MALSGALGTAKGENTKWNRNHSAVRRLMSELQDLERDPSPDFIARPLDGNLFEWHFTVRGPSDSEFQGGIYHGRIILPPEYPNKPPDIVFLTPNGRFEVGTKICLNITSYHKETWNPMWGIRSVMLALISYFPQEAQGIGALSLSKPARIKLAKESVHFKCNICEEENCHLLPPVAQTSSSSTAAGEQPKGTSETPQQPAQDNVNNAEQPPAEIVQPAAEPKQPEPVPQQPELRQRNNVAAPAPRVRAARQVNNRRAATTASEDGVVSLVLDKLTTVVLVMIALLLMNKAMRVLSE